MRALFARLGGATLGARAARASALTVLGFAGTQGLRLAGNLVLTRLLFPEAFGIMALVTVVVMGLSLFSDIGVTPAILQSARGEDQRFLDTAWTVQVARGFLLWAVGAGIALPVSQVYDMPMLAQLLPVACVALAIQGFRPTRLDTANRRLLLGRVTAIELAAQACAIAVAIGAAWATGSIWALVAAGPVAAAVQVGLAMALLPGPRNRLRLDRAALAELGAFGKWVFLATVAGFFFNQGDKLILGRYLSPDVLGIYNVGYFLASFPMMLGRLVTRRVMIPIYREAPPWQGPAQFARLRRMRLLAGGALLTMTGAFAIGGVWLVDLLYDPRYALAGPIVVALACAQMPFVIGLSYDQAALAAGDSRSFFLLAAARAVLMLAGIVAGYELAGLAGALAGQALALAGAHLGAVWLAIRMRVWDAWHDAVLLTLAACLAAVALALNGGALGALPGAEMR